MKHGYTNLTSGDRSVVTKSYRGPDPERRCAQETTVLEALAGKLPVPPLFSCSNTSVIMGRLQGVHGQELIDSGLAEPVLQACGGTLRRIHAVDPLPVVGDSPSADSVLVHGDYGPQNVLLDEAGLEVTGIVDWEWAHAGSPFEDMAWCEWIIRMHHPAAVGDLGSFFAAYGHQPTWSDRHRSMLAQCRALLAFCERWQAGGRSCQIWRQRIAVTESWVE